MFTAQRGDRPDVPNIAIVVTDGISNINAQRTIPEAQSAKDSGVHIFAIGVGLSGNTFELDAMASEPVEDNRFSVQQFDRLADIGTRLFDGVCSSKSYSLKFIAY